MNTLPTKLHRVFLYFNIYFMSSIDPGRLSPKKIPSFSTHFVTVFPKKRREMRDCGHPTEAVDPDLLMLWPSRARLSLSLPLLLGSVCGFRIEMGFSRHPRGFLFPFLLAGRCRKPSNPFLKPFLNDSPPHHQLLRIYICVYFAKRCGGGGGGGD